MLGFTHLGVSPKNEAWDEVSIVTAIRPEVGTLELVAATSECTVQTSERTDMTAHGALLNLPLMLARSFSPARRPSHRTGTAAVVCCPI